MRPVILVILDGFGVAPPGPGNAITFANPTNFNSYLEIFPNTTLEASGEAVGLPAHEVGNTEVGHLNIGAGRIIYQDLPRINLSIADGSFYKNKSIQKSVDHLKNFKGDFHLLGLIGEGTVHSSLEHLYGTLFLAKEHSIQNVYIHLITDGRDSPPQSAIETITRVEERLGQLGVGKIASIIGRYYAMDRDLRWERTEKAYRCLTEGKGQTANSAVEAMKRAYSQGKTDEFVDPTVILQDQKPIALIKENDAVLFFNYRIDRPRQLTKAFVMDEFEEKANENLSFDPYAIKYYKTHVPQREIINAPFKRGEKIKNLFFMTMTQYDEKLDAEVLFPPIVVPMPLGRVISEKDLFQLRMSESEKERFVTFYFNGQREYPLKNEDRLIIPSPKVATYDMKPEMSAVDLTDILLRQIATQKYAFILLNFANPDMVGHTGNIEASVKAVRVVDECLGKIISMAKTYNSTVLITADHGNVEQKINLNTGGISTEHTSNPVPFIVADPQYVGKKVRLEKGILADIAPTVLWLMGIQKPTEMTGRNLLEGMANFQQIE